MVRLLTAFSIVALVALATIGASTAFATDAAVVAQRFPRSFQGTFRWDNSPAVQNVSITLTSARAISSASAEFIGAGTYQSHGKTTQIRVRMLVNATTWGIQIWESDAEGPGPFDTGGVHTGTISPDFSTINARWRSDQGQGTLVLTGTPRSEIPTPSVNVPSPNMPTASDNVSSPSAGQ